MTNSKTTGRIKTTSSLKWIGVGTSMLVGAVLSGCSGNNVSTDNAVTTAPTTSAPDAATSNSAMSNSTSGTSSTGSTGATASASSFKGAAATWMKITATNAALDKVIKSKNLSTVHEAAFALRDIVKTLPTQSQALAPDKQKSLASQVKNVEQVAKMLDESGDAKDQKATEENQSSMNDALSIIKGLYPAGSMK